MTMTMLDHFVKTKDGRVGLAVDQYFGYTEVLFSTDDHSKCSNGSLVHATRVEVAAAGLEHLPGKVWDER